MDPSNVTDMPREKIITLGSQGVSTTELLAVLLGAGTRGRPVMSVAGQLLARLGGLDRLAHASPQQLMAHDGIGLARATRIAAAFQLGRRALEASGQEPDSADLAVAVHRRLAPGFHDLKQEVFVVLPLDSRYRFMGELEVARGSLDYVDVHPREVFRPLIQRAAAAAVVAHNHPSGDPTPSPEDLALTRRLCEVGQLIGIPIVDHIIIGGGLHVSLRQRLSWMNELASAEAR